MIDDDNNPQDGNSHGTHVAGTIDAELTEGELSSQENDVERKRRTDDGNVDRALERNSTVRSTRGR